VYRAFITLRFPLQHVGDLPQIPSPTAASRLNLQPFKFGRDAAQRGDAATPRIDDHGQHPFGKLLCSVAFNSSDPAEGRKNAGHHAARL
jgi:hypothetical protein